MSGWTTFTVDAVDEQSADELRDAFEAGISAPSDATFGGDGASVRGLSWGYGDAQTMNVLKETTDLWERAVVMECNDTSDSGDGTAYESSDGSVERLDSAHGVESARGHDAADELNEYVSEHVYMR